MWLFRKMCNKTLKLKQVAPYMYRYYSTIIEKELEVPVFCDLHIQVPYNLCIKPLNVHKYHNCDKLLLKVDERIQDTLKYDLNGNQVTILDNKEEHGAHDDIVLNVKAPVKSNLYINCKRNVKVGYFHGDKLCIESTNGDISVDKYQGDIVRLITYKGNINIKEFIQATDIDAIVLNKGNISAGRLQSMNLKLETKEGNIGVSSSYSHESHFSTSYGNIELQNAHKSCKIFIDDGSLNLIGFDGKLKTVIDKGSATIQLSKIHDDSEINIMEGSLMLKLSENCQDYTGFKIKTLDWEMQESLKMTAINSDGIVHLIPDIQEQNVVKVNCMNGSVEIDMASWQDMIKMKIHNKNSQ